MRVDRPKTTSGGWGAAGIARPAPSARWEEEPEREEGLAIRERPKTRKPSLYRVLLHNDDYTSMEFVIEALIQYFDKTATDAMRIMLLVHQTGVGVAGVYTRDEAETRMERVTAAARDAGYPLELSMEPE